MLELVLPALLIGLLGAGHCFGMCGGIASALTFALGDNVGAAKKTQILIFYSLGRIISYMLIGAGFSFAFSLLPDSAIQHMRWFTGILLVLMGLYVSGWWKVLSALERLGAKPWALVQPLAARMMPVQNVLQAFLFGAIWGWLPCGLVYTATVYAAAQASLTEGALSMLAFGIGTLPAILSIGALANALKNVLQSKGFRAASGIVLIVFGVWTIWSMGHGSHHHGEHSSHEQPSGENATIDQMKDHSNHSLPKEHSHQHHHH